VLCLKTFLLIYLLLNTACLEKWALINHGWLAASLRGAPHSVSFPEKRRGNIIAPTDHVDRSHHQRRVEGRSLHGHLAPVLVAQAKGRVHDDYPVLPGKRQLKEINANILNMRVEIEFLL